LRPQALAPAAFGHERDARGGQAQGLRASGARGLDPRTGTAPARDHPRIRMAEAVVGASGHQRPRRAHGGDECRVRRAAAAVVRGEHGASAQSCTFAAYQHAFGDVADVAGQQQRGADGGTHAQHAARIVVEVREPAWRMQEPEFDTIPLPRDAGAAIRVRRCADPDG
jgi:hypothetical protein